jgi:predicted DNA-binding WGR domain protein
MADPIQLPLFPDQAALTRIRLDPYPDPGAAINALARLTRAKRRRGYRDSPA